ncbi:MAG: hypothetical protein NC203_00670 [Firmicutes bacterium]|nr:hypothetical protein [Bacillota bacterium]
MDKNEAKEAVTEYLQAQETEFYFLIEREDNEAELVEEETDIIYFVVKAEEVISKHIEVELRFAEERCCCKTYYCQPIGEYEDDGETANRLCRLCNYINTQVLNDPVYQSVMALDEKYGDVFIGTNIRYEVLENLFEYTMDYILKYLLGVLKICCFPLIVYKSSAKSFDEVASVIKKQTEREDTVDFI